MITSEHSKSSYSSGLNPILQKLYEMTCEIIVSKTVRRIFMVKNKFLEPRNHRKLNISRAIYFLKISAHRFVDLICTNKLEEFFFSEAFSFKDLELFHDCKTTNLGIIFFHKRLILYFFSRVII